MSTETIEQEHSDNHHPLSVYFKVWGMLFILSAFSYFVDYFGVETYLKWFLISIFGLLKAGLIVTYFMHMRWERMALVYAIILPPLMLLALVGIMAVEGDYTVWIRNLFFWQDTTAPAPIAH
jgi:caa(3)-type oxidase subunit IV